MIDLRSTVLMLAGLGGLSLICSGARAAEPLFSMLDLSTEHPRLAFAHCPGDGEWHECVSHYLECRREPNQPLLFVIWGSRESGPDVRKMAKSLLDAPWYQASFALLPGSGQAKADFQVYALEVAINEFNADWELTLKTYDSKPLLEAISRADSDGAEIDVTGVRFSLTPRAGDHKKLLAFTKACR